MALFNRTYKDSVFVDLFKRKENFLSLYNSIHKTKSSDFMQIKSQLQNFQDCDILKQYVGFVECIRKLAVPNDFESYRLAIETAISKGYLPEYLKTHSIEVMNMFLAEYDYDEDIAVKKEEAFNEGKEAGILQSALAGAVLLVTKYNQTPETAAADFGISLNELEEALRKNR